MLLTLLSLFVVQVNFLDLVWSRRLAFLNAGVAFWAAVVAAWFFGPPLGKVLGFGIRGAAMSWVVDRFAEYLRMRRGEL